MTRSWHGGGATFPGVLGRAIRVVTSRFGRRRWKERLLRLGKRVQDVHAGFDTRVDTKEVRPRAKHDHLRHHLHLGVASQRESEVVREQHTARAVRAAYTYHEHSKRKVQAGLHNLLEACHRTEVLVFLKAKLVHTQTQVRRHGDYERTREI